ncbi:helix-turn-helix domain-containing protein [Amycolatopsis aidingensis]|uniref:helix-turn-helix domain-containing protein n=1 Tax=Amycolatopsis aidingensis TaxID=2842453 RepID=UPI001C0D266D|nr:Scr1 family TA system antitoxin-like transcriptional regulator [Amycolatopsis aidingensis]
MATKRDNALRFWGRELALARDSRGLSQEALAQQAYISHSLVAMWETGRRSPKTEDLARIEEILGSNGYLSRLLTELVAREVAHEWLDRWIEVESRATTILSFQTTVVDGLLQTPDYARAVLKNEDLVQVRLERQRVLTEGDPPMLHGPFIIASFDGGSDMAYVDNQLRGNVVEQPEDVASLRQMFELFRADALSTRQSIELIEKVAEQWTNP